MSELIQIAKRIAAPTSAFRGLVATNIVYRVSIMVTGLFVAQIFGRITEAVATHASVQAVFLLGAQAFGAIALNTVMLFVMVELRAGYPNLSVYASREIRKRILDEYFTKEVSIHAPTGKTLSIFENGMGSWIALCLRMTVEDPINLISFAIGFGYLVYADTGMVPIALGYMLAVALLSSFIQRKVKPLNEERRKAKEQ